MQVLEDKAEKVCTVLEQMGVVSLSGVLSDATCDTLLAHVNDRSDKGKAEVEAGEVPFGDRFGGVNCRGQSGMFGQRQDMFLSTSNEVVSILF